jgi:hypothetical protein
MQLGDRMMTFADLIDSMGVDSVNYARSLVGGDRDRGERIAAAGIARARASWVPGEGRGRVYACIRDAFLIGSVAN